MNSKCSMHFCFQGRQMRTLSQPENAWKNGRASDRSGPRALLSSWLAKYRRFLPVPKATHSSSSCAKRWQQLIAKTTTSVSTVLIMIFLWPSWTAWATCRNIRMSASSWEHGSIRSTVTSDGQHSVWQPSEIISCLLLLMAVSFNCLDKKLNSSFLLASTRKNQTSFEARQSIMTRGD